MTENGNSKYIWELKFDSYSDAHLAENRLNNRHHQNFQGGFDSIQWQLKQESMLHLALKGELSHSSILPELLPEIKIQNIIDYGGGPGWIWAYLLKMNLGSNLNYFNIELSSSRILNETAGVTLPRMNFVDSGDSLNLIGEQNLLYSNSVLQYFEDNSNFIKVIAESDPTFIVLDDVIGSTEEFFSLQNYYGYYQIHRFLNISELTRQICEKGYKLSVQKPYDKHFTPLMIPKIWLGGQENPDCEIPPSWTLVFRRN